MMDRSAPGLSSSSSSHDPRQPIQLEHTISHTHYDPYPLSPLPRQHLSRSVTYPNPTLAPSYAQMQDQNLSSSSLPLSQTPKDDQTQAYIGLGITLPPSTTNTSTENPTPQIHASPESPFGTHAMLSARYPGTGQPPTPSFPTLRSSSPASSTWSASDTGNSVAPASSGFIPRLHKMVSDEKYSNLISWSPAGTSFYISRVPEFSSTVLPQHFKHSNFSSFVRQLNMYGFHKVNKTPRGYKIPPESQVWEFSHTKFVKHRPDLLDEIKRRQGDVDFIREGDVGTHVNLLHVQQNDILKQLGQLQEQVSTLITGLNETRARQQGQEDKLRRVLDYLEKQQQQNSPSSSQGSTTHTLQRKQSIQRTPSRRPSNVSRLVLDDSSDRRYSASQSSQELEPFLESDVMTAGQLGTPPQSSPIASQPSSGGSGNSPGQTKGLRAAPTFSTPSSINSKSTGSTYTPTSSFTSISSVHQRSQSVSVPSPPTLRRNKSVVMGNLSSPNVTPTHAPHFPAQYAPSLATIESGQVLSQELSTRPHTSHQASFIQPAQPPATYQSAAAPYATPPRVSVSQSQFTTPQFQPPSSSQLRQDQFVPDALQQLASPASFTPSTSFFQQLQQQQQQQQQRRRRQESDTVEEMDIA